MHYETLRLATDAGLGARARIGMLVLKTDQTLEFEAAHLYLHADRRRRWGDDPRSAHGTAVRVQSRRHLPEGDRQEPVFKGCF